MTVERLTEHHFKKQDGFYMTCSEHCSKEDFSCEDCGELDKLVDRLGTIEDILGDDYDLDRLRELVEADRDGRCVVLPCKVGDVIYRISLSESKIYEFSVGREFWNGGRFTLFSHPVLGDGKIATCYEVIEQKDFGKTVFLTLEEAQAALEIERMKIHG